ncbi:SPOR domain-containing protein [Gilliamella sp. Occ3-1]|uniref:SPOR domain-containing protein n=1 Tax=unclassified Gilliamella TaxID=2685620 RepID=UPI00080E1A17|nr:SPOR domain-containing protein [Gilliamella apicola]OCG71386.1 hypothetical protein A9G43_04725 [Gilliamella apicola]
MRVDKEDRYISEKSNKDIILSLKLSRILQDFLNKKLIIVILSTVVILLLLSLILFKSSKEDKPTPLTLPENNGVATSQVPDDLVTQSQDDLALDAVQMDSIQNIGSEAQINQSSNEHFELLHDKNGNLEPIINQEYTHELNHNQAKPLTRPNINSIASSDNVKKNANSTKTGTNKNNFDKKIPHHKTDEIVTSANNLKLDNNSYSIQLAASKSVDGLKKLINEHKITNYQIYGTKRNNEKWYVLIKGNYSSSEEAHKAIKSLPSALQKDKPWVKSSATINKEKAAK